MFYDLNMALWSQFVSHSWSRTGAWWRGLLAITPCGLLGGCGPGMVGNHQGSGLDETGSVETETVESGSSSAANDTSAAETVAESDGSGTGEGGIGFINEPDGGSMEWECSLWDQNCPQGEKCNIYANDGGSSWNATKCVPIVDDPDEVGEPCTVEGSGVSGLDSCVLGSVCWDVDPETNTGTCISFCIGSETNPTCPDPSQLCSGRDFMLCLPLCCPLEQDCADGQGCYPINDEFTCAPDASGDAGAFGDGCEFLNVCDPGLFCANADTVPNCHGSLGCCSEFCDLTNPNASAGCLGASGGQECVPWYQEGQAPPGFEHTGVCAIPS